MQPTANVMPIVYTRKLSRQEVEDGSILITKDNRDKFPQPGVSFHLFVLGEDYRVQIEAEDGGSADTAQQYRLRADAFASRVDWQVGATLRLRKLDEESYLLETEMAD